MDKDARKDVNKGKARGQERSLSFNITSRKIV
jgi:hypothetical protein